MENRKNENTISKQEITKMKINAKKFDEEMAKITNVIKSSKELKAQDILLQSGQVPLFKISGIRNPIFTIKAWNNTTFDIFLNQVMKIEDSVKLKNATSDLQRTIIKSEIYTNALGTAKKMLKALSGTYDFNLTFLENNFRCHLYSATPKGIVDGEFDDLQIVMNIRVVPKKMPELNELNLPSQINEIFKEQSGLVLVSGSAGDGKSTTVASIINQYNNSNTKFRTIVTIEEPIEFLHQNNQAYIIQRSLVSNTDITKAEKDKLGIHGNVSSYEKATEDALREDCDIVVIGELRNESAMHNALRLVEAGKLVIASIHGKSVSDTIEKFLSEFKLSDYEKIKTRLANNLLAVVHQNLVLKDEKQYPLASVLVVRNDTNSPKAVTDFRKIVMAKKENILMEEQIETYMLSSHLCITKEERFDEMVSEGIFTENDRPRFF